jgi:mannose-6-phosphate isomerase
VPAGSLHAILEGIVIAEIQQNSNTTYRVYDWNHVGHDGNPRPLHVAKALDVTNFAQVEPTLQAPTLAATENGVTRHCLCSNSYFNVERVTMAAGAIYNGDCDGSTFEIWGTIEGNVTVSAENHTINLPRVRFTLLPATMGKFTVSATTDSILLRAFVG